MKLGGQSEVYLRPVSKADCDAFVGAMQRSRKLHEPWIFPPRSREAFQRYFERMQTPDHEGLLICRELDDQLVGVINLNNIVRGALLSASLGYYAVVDFNGRGYMYQGLNLVVELAFDVLGLHRLEACIQPDNTASLNLVRGAGFRFEGLSPSLLYIAGAWRDHERWALLDTRATLLPPGHD